MKITRRQIKKIVRKSLEEAYEKTEYIQDRPDYERLEKLRKAGRFEKSNISKADEEEAAAQIKYREDLRKDYERKVAEIEKMKQKRKARRGETYRMEESMDLDPSFYADAPERYDGDIAYERIMTVVEVLAAYPAAHSYLDIEDVASEIIDALEENGLI